MAGLDEKLLGAGASASNNWAAASAETALTFTGQAQFRRGVEVEIGIGALATADAGLSKFVDASVRGNAFAEAKASLQLQLPLNLFEQFGLAVGAQAVAQAAAGIEAGLGASAGDIVNFVVPNRDSAGLPIDLMLLLIDEAVLGGHFEIHVSASAMAYASLNITGELVTDPGFHYTVDAGLGLAAGFGFSGGLDIGLRDFRRFYGRAVDLTMASVTDGLVDLLKDRDPDLIPVVRTMAPVASTALRLAYELGFYIAKNRPPVQDHQAALTLSNHCVGIVLEEAQRFLFGRCLEAGLGTLRRFVTDEVPNMAVGEWDTLLPQRRALADTLRRMPNDPFQPTDDNAAYWAELLDAANVLVGALASSVSGKPLRGIAMVFAAVKLLTQAIRVRVNKAEAYAFAIGAGGASTPVPPPFVGPLEGPAAPPRIAAHINAAIGHGANDPITYPDLISYVVSDGVMPVLRGVAPEVDAFLGIFHNTAVSGNLNDVLRALLTHRDAFVKNAAGDRDPQETLRVLVGALSTFIDIKITEQLVPAVNAEIGDGSIKTYFDEVIVGTLIFTKNVAFQTVLNWEKAPIDRSAFTEALSGILVMLLGRSLVLVGDGFTAALQDEMGRACNHAAEQLQNRDDPFTAMGIAPSPELRELFVETLRVGAEVFGPLPTDTRRRLRYVLYDVFETLPPREAAQSEFVTNLKDQFFIPNQESLDELSQELLEISRDRFALFAERMLAAGGTFLIKLIEDAIEELVEAVRKWISDIEQSIQDLAAEILAIERAIERLLADAREAFDDAVEQVDAFLEMFSKQSLRSRLRRDIRDKLYGSAKDVLRDNDFYKNLPSPAKRFARGVLKDAISTLIENPVLDPIFDAVGSVAGELDGLLDDVRELDPDEPLGPQLLDLAIDRMEDRIRDEFGGTSPHISVGFDLNAFGFSHHFHLGSIHLSFSKLLSILRAAVRDLNFYEDALATAAASLSAAFAKAIEVDAKQQDRDRKKASHDRLSRIRNDFSSDPKTITIVNPVEALSYDGDVEIEISLGSVPVSYLGLEPDEQPRVVILINGEKAPLQAAAVSSTVPPASADPVVPMSSGALSLAPSLRSVAAARSARSTAPMARQVIRPAAGKPAAGAPAGRTPIVTHTVIENIAPGRRMTPTKRRTILAGLPAGTTVRLRANRDQLVAGANTLAVVVIDPDGQRYQQVVNFAVSTPPARPVPGRLGFPGVKLPAMPGRRPPGKPIQPAHGINPHFNRVNLTAHVKKGVRDVVRKPMDGPQ